MSIDSAQIYTDFEGLAALRARARDNEDAALDEVSRQFESMFLQMMLKSMRDASFGGGLMDSKQSEFYRDMYDKQLAVDMSSKQGIGLADVLKRQLGGGGINTRHQGQSAQDYLGMPIHRAPDNSALPVEATRRTEQQHAVLDGSPEAFIQSLWPAAEKAAAELGIAPQALLAQAALETGWGKHVMRQRDGGNSHNLFGIKADTRWQGDQVQVSTLEYREGVALKTRANFRAYESYEQSFSDYVSFIKNNPRYRQALEQTAEPDRYFFALQQAGYATDPVYADKVMQVFNSETMQEARHAMKEGVRTI